jgi:hypothetical protein
MRRREENSAGEHFKAQKQPDPVASATAPKPHKSGLGMYIILCGR